MLNRRIITNYKNFLLLEQKIINKEGQEVPGKEIQKDFEFLKKEPKYIQLFYNFKELEGKTKEELVELYDRIKAHRNTLKQNKVDLLKFETYEELSDELYKINLIEKTNKFVKIIPNPLRNNIKSDIDYMKDFSDLIIGYDYDDYKNVFLRNIEKYRYGSVEDFFVNFKRHLKNLAPIKKTLEEIKQNPNAEIVHIDDNYIIALIYSVEASCNLGSAQWCISNNSAESMWSDYIITGRGHYGNNDSDTVGVQYFIWDLTQDSTSVQYKNGVTIYDDKKPLGNYLDNSPISNIKDNGWYKYLKSWENLENYQKIKLVSENPEMEKKVKVLDTLSDTEKKEYIFKYPKLLKYADSLSVFNNDEIWQMVKTDADIAKFEQVALELTGEQKIQVVINNPNLLEINFKNKNVYTSIQGKLTREQKLKMISNKHTLLNKFKLTSDEIVKLIEINPTILVTYTNLLNRVDNVIIKNMYLDNKKDWDRKIARTSSDNKTKVELLLAHLIKDEDRINKESTKKCYFFLGNVEEIDGKKYLIPTSGNNVVYVEDVLNPDPLNHTLFQLITKSENSDSIGLYSSWVSVELGNVYMISLSPEELVKRSGDDKKQLSFFDQIQDDYTSYDNI